MANIDLSNYLFNELRSLQHDVETEIKSRHQRDLAKARQQILAIAHAAGVTIDELLVSSLKKSNKSTRRKVPGQFKKNPAD